MNDIGDFSWLRLAFAFSVVAGLMAAMGFILKYIGTHGVAFRKQVGRARRLKIVETLPIDTKRRAVILNCDGREHLLLLSAERDIVIETNLSSPQPADKPQ